jgi:serine protease
MRSASTSTGFRLMLLALTASAVVPASLPAAEHNPVAREPRASNSSAPDAGDLAVIVKLRSQGPGAVIAKLSNGSERAAALAKRTGLDLQLRREISESLFASSIQHGNASVADTLARLRSDGAVEYAAIDHRRFAHATTPNDPLFTNQWYLKNVEVSAVDAIDAWDLEKGSSGIVIAVLDTGVLYDHPDLGRGDLAGRLLPGFDFVTASQQTNDGNARDADPSDPGDWIDSTDKANPLYANCDTTTSSWHGTRVAGMIGALTNNSVGVAGLDWNSFILPVRVLGKCGGVDSDILAGMRWAAGLHVPGAADNPTPARVLNASFGSSSACEPAYRDVIDELTARKVLLVISAGNEGTVVSSPANCPGVAAVAAIRHAGSKVGFSNLGPEVTVSAPGGNCVNLNGGPCLFSLDTTSNSGTTSPATHTYTDQQNSNLGTSFSAPIVSGIAALMLSRNANLSTAQLLARLQEGARPFPTAVPDDPTLQTCHVPASDQDVQLTQCLCTTSTCGAGMANAAGSVAAADRPIAAVTLPSTIAAGQNVVLTANASAASCGRTIANYAWAVIAPAVNPPAIVGADTSVATVVAPSSGSITLRLTVTDSQNRSDSTDITVESDRVTSAAPSSAGNAPCAAPITSGPTPGGSSTPPPSTPSTPPKSTGGGGGGGSLGLDILILLGAITSARARRRLGPRLFRCI